MLEAFFYCVPATASFKKGLSAPALGFFWKGPAPGTGPSTLLLIIYLVFRFVILHEKKKCNKNAPIILDNVTMYIYWKLDLITSSTEYWQNFNSMTFDVQNQLQREREREREKKYKKRWEKVKKIDRCIILFLKI